MYLRSAMMFGMYAGEVGNADRFAISARDSFGLSEESLNGSAA